MSNVCTVDSLVNTVGSDCKKEVAARGDKAYHLDHAVPLSKRTGLDAQTPSGTTSASKRKI